MAATTSLEQLIRELPLDERKQLYHRIQRSLSIRDEEERRIYHADLPKERRSELIRDEIGRLGLWGRLVFWFMRITSRKPDEQVFLKYRLGQFRREVRLSGELIDFEQRLALPELARRIYGFYRVCYPAIPLFRRLWKTPDFLQMMVSYLLERRIPNARTDLTQFMSMKEMQDLFISTETKQAIRKEVSIRLDGYLGSLQPDLFVHLEEGLLPLYFLKNLMLFPFDELFRRFGVEIGYELPESPPAFKPTLAVEIVDLLEQLYYGIYSARRIPADASLHDELLDYYVTNERSEGDDYVAPVPTSASPFPESGTAPSAPPGSGQPTSGDSTHAAALRAAVRSVRKELDSLLPRLKLVEIIKSYHEDPYYRFLVYMPRLDLREYYASSLSAGIVAQAERRFADVRMGVIGRMITQIFKTEPPEFENFRPSAITSVKVPGIPVVRYVKSLNIIYNFIRLNYFGGLQDLVRDVVQLISARYRDLQTSLQFHASALEDLVEKIRAFDLSFSTDTDEGKTLQRLRIAMEKDPALQRTYRITLAQKDREARTLIDKGTEHIQAVQAGFEEIARSPDQGLAQRLSAVTATSRPGKSLDAAVKECIETFASLRKLLNQLIAMEEGY